MNFNDTNLFKLYKQSKPHLDVLNMVAEMEDELEKKSAADCWLLMNDMIANGLLLINTIRILLNNIDFVISFYYGLN
jgi:hypothetical protein